MPNNSIILSNIGQASPLPLSDFNVLANTSANNGAFDYRFRPITLLGNAGPSNTWSLFDNGSLAVAGAANSAYIDSNLSDFSFGSEDFAIELGVRPTSIGNSGGFLGSWNNVGQSNNSWLFYHNPNGTITFFWSTNGTAGNTITSNQSVNAGDAKRISVSRNGSTIRMFFDGTEVGSGAITGAIAPAVIRLDIGAYASGTNGTWTGNIDELRITKYFGLYSSAYSLAVEPFTTTAAVAPVLRMRMNADGFPDDMGHAVTKTGSVTRITSNKREGASSVSFGAGAYLKCAASSDWNTGNTLTIEFSAYRTADLAADTYCRPIAFGPNGWGGSFCVQMDSAGAIQVVRPFGGSAPLVAPGSTWSLNDWADMMVSIKNGVASFYVDGVRVAGPTAIDIGYADNDLYIGGGSIGAPYDMPFPGMLDRIVITKGTALIDPSVTSYPIMF